MIRHRLLAYLRRPTKRNRRRLLNIGSPSATSWASDIAAGPYGAQQQPRTPVCGPESCCGSGSTAPIVDGRQEGAQGC